MSQFICGCIGWGLTQTDSLLQAALSVLSDSQTSQPPSDGNSHQQTMPGQPSEPPSDVLVPIAFTLSHMLDNDLQKGSQPQSGQ